MPRLHILDDTLCAQPPCLSRLQLLSERSPFSVTFAERSHPPGLPAHFTDCGMHTVLNCKLNFSDISNQIIYMLELS